MKNIFRILPMFLLFNLAVNPCGFADNGAGTSSAVILKLSDSPRAEGMGGAYTAVSNEEAGAAGWNPAGLYYACQQNVSAAFYRGLVDDAFSALTYSQTLGDSFALGCNLLYYDAGRFDLINASEASSEVAAERDLLGVLTGAYKLNLFNRDWLLGANLKLLYSSLLESASAFSASLDLGVMSELKEIQPDLYGALVVKNLGTPLKYTEVADPLPLEADAGVSYRLLKGDTHDLLLAADASWGIDHSLRGALGVEYWHARTVALRAGYMFNYGLETFTLGCGLCCLGMQLDYAFGMMNALNSTHHVSLTYTFATDEKRQQGFFKSVAAKPTPAPTAVPSGENETEEKLANVISTPKGELEEISAEVVEFQRFGGRVDKVIINAGSLNHLQAGLEGTLVDAAGKIQAGIIIRQVDPKLSLAEVIALGHEVSGNVRALVQVPVKTIRPAEPVLLPPVRAEILEIGKIGGEAKSVVLSVGKNQGIRRGNVGSVFNAAGAVIAKIKVTEVYPYRCAAEILEKTAEINGAAKVEIIPVKSGD